MTARKPFDIADQRVTICIPSIPRRSGWLGEAVESVAAQWHPCQVSVAIDHRRDGAWITRNRAVRQVLLDDDPPEWIGFLDDDDFLLPHHVTTLLECARHHDADVVWPWFEVEGGTDPFPGNAPPKMYDPAAPHIFPITYLVRTWALKAAFRRTRGFQADPNETGGWHIQDQPIIDALWRITDGRFACTPERTWVWRHHASNTSGLPTR